MIKTPLSIVHYHDGLRYIYQRATRYVVKRVSHPENPMHTMQKKSAKQPHIFIFLCNAYDT